MAINKGKNTGKGSSSPSKNPWDPWDNRSNDWDAQRHAWIVKNVYGKKNPFQKSRYGGLMVDPNRRDIILRQYDKGVTLYGNYLAAQQDRLNNPGPQEESPYKGSGASNWQGWDHWYANNPGKTPNLWGSGPKPKEEAPPRALEAARSRRWESIAPHYRDFGPTMPARNAGGAAPAFRQAPGSSMSNASAVNAINKWNEFQQRRSNAWAGAPQNQGTMSNRGKPTASRFNLGGNQMPTIRQQQWGQQGGNLNAALMQTAEPYAGPKG